MEATRRRFRIKIDDLIWHPAERGALYTNVYNAQAGEVVLEAGPEAGPSAAGRFYAAAYGFLGVTIWERTDFESLEDAQIQGIRWWRSVTAGTPPAAQATPVAPAKRRPGRPKQKKTPAKPPPGRPKAEKKAPAR